MGTHDLNIRLGTVNNGNAIKHRLKSHDHHLKCKNAVKIYTLALNYAHNHWFMVCLPTLYEYKYIYIDSWHWVNPTLTVIHITIVNIDIPKLYIDDLGFTHRLEWHVELPCWITKG